MPDEGMSAKQARIEEFLNGRECFIPESRPQTRRALAECLARVPAPLMDYLFTAGRLVLVAPRCSTCEVASIRHDHAAPVSESHFVAVFLDWKLERVSYAEARRIVAITLSDALNSLIGDTAELRVHAGWAEAFESSTEARPN
jgi:hypothetical protein